MLLLSYYLYFRLNHFNKDTARQPTPHYPGLYYNSAKSQSSHGEIEEGTGRGQEEVHKKGGTLQGGTRKRGFSRNTASTVK